MEKIKSLTDNARERKRVTWDGKIFRVIQDNKLHKISQVIILNPREMLELIRFAGSVAEE